MTEKCPVLPLEKDSLRAMVGTQTGAKRNYLPVFCVTCSLGFSLSLRNLPVSVKRKLKQALHIPQIYLLK